MSITKEESLKNKKTDYLWLILGSLGFGIIASLVDFTLNYNDLTYELFYALGATINTLFICLVPSFFIKTVLEKRGIFSRTHNYFKTITISHLIARGIPLLLSTVVPLDNNGSEIFYSIFYTLGFIYLAQFLKNKFNLNWRASIFICLYILIGLGLVTMTFFGITL